MDHLFIVNPAAGKGKSLDYIPVIEKAFQARPGDSYIIEKTLYPGHAVEIVKKYVQEKKYIVWSVGGDGTMNEVLNGIAGSSSSLAIIPCGSGNDFVKSLPEYKDRENIVDSLLKGKETRIDLGKVGDRFYINISSLGFDAKVVYKTNIIKKIPFITGMLAYTLGVITCIISPGKNKVKILIDDTELYEEILLIAVANGRYYGGGMQPAPLADIRDGILNICLIKKVTRLRMLKFLPLFIKGAHSSIREVSFYEGKKITVIPDGKIPFNIDGEVSMTEGAMVFSVIPSGLRLIIPD